MPQPDPVQILDEDLEVDAQSMQAQANIACQALQDAAYWRGKCDGMAETVAYLKDRLNKAEALLFCPKPIVTPAGSPLVAVAAEEGGKS